MTMQYSEDIKSIWEQVKTSFVERDKFSQTTIELWFGDLSIVSFQNNEIVFSTDSPYKFDILQKKYVPLIAVGFERLLGFPMKVKLILVPREFELPIVGIPEHPLEGEPKVLGSTMPTVNFEYTFQNFIEGSSNTFVRAACWAVAETASRAVDGYTATGYNPLFIYGPSGIGKTHLLYAIMNKVNAENPSAKIIYIKGDDFTNQMVDSLAHQAMPKFRDEYRKCDLLLIDDIQFIAGKVSTQEEFFHTFNALYESGKQIILTSDRPPREIKPLEDRLKSRFEMGLIADIQPPDLELRIAIIKKKAEQVDLDLPDEVLTFLAENLRTNIRQIEGAIKKLSAIRFLSGQEITLEVTRNQLTELLGGAEPVHVTVDKIFASVYKHYGFKKEELVGVRRTKELASARHITIYLIRQITEMSLPNIGKMFNRDHTTIMASFDVVEKKRIHDPMLENELAAMTKEVTDGTL